MSLELTIAVKDKATELALELLDNKSVLNELERAFPYLDGAYYYARKLQVTSRIENIEAILSRVPDLNFRSDIAPEQQFLVTTRQ